ncbi:Choline transport system permease protein OpuBB [Pirellula sp. SH-Sr6A]|nr:Choline transport system permease protein OpuBB [Pirellula sp. SH-Sr6A]
MQVAVRRITMNLAFLVSLLLAPTTRAETEVKVGSKGFTESVLLGECLAHLARSTGARCEHKAELGGTQVLWKALQAGDVDAYVDYTGTIREELLSDAIPEGNTIRSEQDMREAMAKKGILMSDRLGFNNTYALGMREADAARLGITRISDLRNHPKLEIGISDEFMERQDGWKQLAEKYRFPDFRIKTMDHNLAYRGLEKGAIDVTDIYTTDAEIDFYKLRVLEDDLGYFPTYYAVILMRQEFADRNPPIAAKILELVGKLDSKTMSAMSAKVRLDRELESNVAASFLNEVMQLDAPMLEVGRKDQFARMVQRLIKTTREHVLLVAISLLLAIMCAVPLGTLSAKNEHFGNVILGVVSVVQTLPSMALLVFMIPIFGLGALPAIAALFFYSLLPIVRNTYSGLTQIPTNTMESAVVLGLPPAARLKLVEIPLAMPSILAGIKTAAVINVGTATIGALIGAGGYGAPILTGIRLMSLPLILQGAIPAAAMAVLVQYAFSFVEKRFVSPGLRLR